MAELLLGCGAEVVAHDPYVREADWWRVLNHDHQVPLTADLWGALEGADCAALVTRLFGYAQDRHREYQGLALEGADCAALVTRPFGYAQDRHREYQGLALEGVRDVMRTPVLVDGRNVFLPEKGESARMVYRGVGKGA